jgi:glutamate--cysteine ligase
MGATVALMTGLIYDQQALSEAWSLVRGFDYDRVQADRPALVRSALDATLCGEPMRKLAERTLEIASGGLARRARLDSAGQDERVHLASLQRLVERGFSPADELLQGLAPGAELSVAEIIARTEMKL